jgi:phosphatidate cytidylyltransferase
MTTKSATSPKPFSGLAARVISALVGVGVLVGAGYFGGSKGWIVVAGAIVLLAQNEFGRIFFAKERVSERAVFLALTVFTFVVSIFKPDFALPMLAGCTVILFSIFMRLGEEAIDPSHRIASSALGTLGLLYVGILPGLALHLLTLQNGFQLFLVLLLTVFSGDIFAYFVGIRFRGPKLWPAASPNKTWSGSIGGLSGSILVGSLMGHWLLPDYSVPLLVATTFLGGVSAQMGDLFESLLKRAAGVKDSGTLMPGHGGLLDRIDGVLFCAPWFYLLHLWQAQLSN